ncbi:hypothetical protein Pint_28212 [Pistacia integerrima]|uniref:Uncharacterized protein n=1 Tax=Pistacia integerrima TaxID=434235 RepID=A0ACC0YU45_9ROSI|nr:hypothetical protein Pint_28212 [Pistacia integerrima]
MMGGQSSKKKGSDATPPALQMKIDSQFSADLSSYEAACTLDPDLQSFDNIIHERTSRVINTLSTGVEVRSLSFDSLKEVTGSLLDMNQEVAKVILECKKDVWNNQELFDLVEEYFESSIQILDFCNVFENCLKRARNSQLIIKLAVKQFEEEMGLQDGVDEKRYVKTLEELKRFKEAGDPFTEEFFTLFQLVHKQQLSMLQKLLRRKRKLDKKLKSMKTWRMVSNVLFVSVFVSVLIFSVVAAAIAAPPFVTALAGALAVPIGSVGKWCNSLWKGYESALKGQKDLISSMQIGTLIKINDLDHIRILVNKLEIEMESLLNNADFALREEDVVKLAIDEIKKKLEVFMETIEVLCEHADKCSRDIRRARTVILQKIIKYPNN